MTVITTVSLPGAAVVVSLAPGIGVGVGVGTGTGTGVGDHTLPPGVGLNVVGGVGTGAGVGEGDGTKGGTTRPRSWQAPVSAPRASLRDLSLMPSSRPSNMR
mmetsp:Transcript_70148/g.162231  ORF Transcript_70148/g.162231 Transcript_70148/m.162231 type:complete len:102 (-) Transcript_70148:701-1006(-)